MEQIGIALFGVLGIWLSQDPEPNRRKFACIAGLLGQPFWFYATYKAAQWGMFGLCFAYTYAWARGFMLHWVKPYA